MPWPWDRIPPWATALIGQQLSDLTDRIRQPEFVAGVRQRLDRVIAEVPDAAARKVDQVVRSAKKAAENVQRWADNRSAPVVNVINATGIVFPYVGVQPPLAAEVAMAWSAAASAWSEPSIEHEGSRAQRALRTRAEALANCSARAAATFPAAIAVATFLGDRPVTVPRCCANSLGAAGPLPDALRSMGIAVEEVGSVGGLQPTDDLSIADGATVLLWIDDASQTELLHHSVFKHAKRIAVAPRVWPRDGNLSAVANPLTISGLLASGAHAVVIPGGGLLGGPSCGVVFAPADLLARIDHQPLWRSLRADVPTQAALVTAMEIWIEGHAAQRFSSVSAIASSDDNVRHRASLLKTRLEAIDGLEISTTENPAKVWPQGVDTIPSVQLLLRRSNANVSEWKNALAAGVPVVWASVQDDWLVLDVRTIEPTSEAALIAALGGDLIVERLSAIVS